MSIRLTRRTLLRSGATLAAPLAAASLGCRSASSTRGFIPHGRLSPDETADLEGALAQLLAKSGAPGLAAAMLRNGEIVWSGGFGFADLGRGVPMTADTLMNIGSVTKTITTTAVLQQIEAGRLTLDDDVQRWIPFGLRNPNHPDEPITIRQLLTHCSSILDGDAYGESYRLGDQDVALGDWLRTYFADDEDCFHIWAPGTIDPDQEPGEARAYSNVAFGLLGHLVELSSELDYEAYCRQRIFEPLGMMSSGFALAGIDRDRHAVPYARVDDDFTPSDEFELASLARTAVTERPPAAGEMFPLGLYSFATPPDGLARTSANELALFLSAWIGRGALLGGPRIFSSGLAAQALSESHFGRALCWDHYVPRNGSERLVVHDGGDPGIATLAAFREQQRTGVVLMTNTDDPGPLLGQGVKTLMMAADPSM